MNKYFKILLLFAGVFVWSSCEDRDRLDVDAIEVPAGYALSAGTSTGFYNSSVAYDQGASWLSGTYDVRFNKGDRLYDNVIIVVVVVTAMQVVQNLPTGPASSRVATMVLALMVLPHRSFISPERMVRSSRITDVSSTIRLSMACALKAS